jgi:mycoredoxin
MISRFFKRAPQAEPTVGNGPVAATETDAARPGVVVYTTTWCISCRLAKRYLNQRKIAFEEIDIEQTPDAAEHVMSLARGYRTVPTFKVGETVVVDWNQNALERALESAGIS